MREPLGKIPPALADSLILNNLCRVDKASGHLIARLQLVANFDRGYLLWLNVMHLLANVDVRAALRCRLDLGNRAVN